jgi:hypothetical protein
MWRQGDGGCHELHGTGSSRHTAVLVTNEYNMTRTPKLVELLRILATIAAVVAVVATGLDRCRDQSRVLQWYHLGRVREKPADRSALQCKVDDTHGVVLVALFLVELREFDGSLSFYTRTHVNCSDELHTMVCPLTSLPG